MPDTSSASSLNWKNLLELPQPRTGQSGWSTTVSSFFNTMSGHLSQGEIALGRKTLAATEVVPTTGMELFSISSEDNYIAFVKTITLIGLDSGDTTNQTGCKFGRGGTAVFADWAANRTVNFGAANNKVGMVLFADDSFSASSLGDARNISLGTGVAPGESFGVISTTGVRCDSITVTGLIIPYS